MTLNNYLFIFFVDIYTTYINHAIYDVVEYGNEISKKFIDFDDFFFKWKMCENVKMKLFFDYGIS